MAKKRKAVDPETMTAAPAAVMEPAEEPTLIMPPPAPPPALPPGPRNRIVEYRRLASSELLANPLNWRTHPEAQVKAMQGVLQEIGQTAALLAYRSERHGGKLVLIDGHLRLSEADEWDVAITDLTDEEADKLLLVYDPIGLLASRDAALMADLMGRFKTEHEGLAGLVEFMAKRQGVPETMYTPNLNPEGSSPGLTAEELAKRQAEMAARLGHSTDMITVTCPKCVTEFYVAKDQTGYNDKNKH